MYNLYKYWLKDLTGTLTGIPSGFQNLTVLTASLVMVHRRA